ncbi:MAG TPA: tetratricopeptide repeat protein, partial [Elusimicrobiota bacterium]|nr:tetratricopeptide repeat protein [Elusimicrobiota bacterium]
NLNILLQRYPDSDWAERGRELKRLLPPEQKEQPAAEAEPATTAGGNPEGALKRIQADLRDHRDDDAARECRGFLERYATHPSAPEVQLALGAVLVRRGDPAAAEKVLAPLARSASGELRAKAQYLLGGARYLLGDSAGVRSAVPESPEPRGGRWSALAQLWRAAADEMDGRESAAAARYKGVAEAPYPSPLKAYALAALAARADRARRYGEAESRLRETMSQADAAELSSVSAAARLALGHVLYKEKKLPQAAAAYGEFARRYPEHVEAPRALYLRGLALKRSGHAGEAAASFKDLIARHPDSSFAADAHLQLGQVYSSMGRSEAAIQSYQEMAKSAGAKSGADKESILLVAQVHYNAKRYKEAIPEYWKFLERFPDDPKAHEVEELLLTSYWAGDRENPDLYKAVERFPNHAIVGQIGPEVLFRRGESLMKSGDHAQAAEAYRAVSARYPGSKQASAAQFRLGSALFAAGDYEASQEAYGKVQSGSGTMAADALFNRALAFEKAGHKGSALVTYEQLLTRFPAYPRASWVWLEVAQLREAHGRYGPAAEAYGRVSEPERRAQALLAMGRCYERMKRRDKARSAYEKLVPLRPREDAQRLNGLVRLGLLYEVAGKARRAKPLYEEVARLASGAAGDAARTRLAAMSGGGARSQAQEYPTEPAAEPTPSAAPSEPDRYYSSRSPLEEEKPEPEGGLKRFEKPTFRRRPARERGTVSFIEIRSSGE